ncbi:hypothetical protein LCGC14_0858420 [marine sediment metagenome]|uniref:Holliday junction resolvase RuvC n=1 Tax=marine sediment metagenome TaxID=412755 RepID=A0A0F9P816_9ZZZZ
MSKSRMIVGLDAGLTHLGIMVAELPRTLQEKPKPIYLATSKAPPNPTQEERRHGISVMHRSVERIQVQVHAIADIHSKYDPVAYFIEMPSGGGKSAAASRGMAYSIAYIATTLYLLAWEKEIRYLSPQAVKKAVIGWHTGSKLEVAEKVFEFWPEVDSWPGFRIVQKKGKQDKALGHDSTDAGAVIITATQTDLYKSLVGGNCRSSTTQQSSRKGGRS